jgi:UDP:flavonoid glycosyltransferase YjiC (YdhE family)
LRKEAIAVICLVAHCGYLSATSRMLEIHRALRERGAPVRVITHGGPYERVLRAAGVPYDVVGPHMTDTRAATFLRDELGVGDVRQSMYSDEELRAYVTAEADYFRAHGVTVAVTGFTLTTLLSTRLAGGVRLVTEHAGSWIPPVWERGLLPVSSTPVVPGTRLLPGPLARRIANAAPPRLRFYTGGFNRVAAELGVEGVPSLPALVLGDLALVPEVPQVLGVPAGAVDGWRPTGRHAAAYRPGTRLRCTGPLYARLDLPLADRVAEFLRRPGPPIVYVAVNSSAPGLVRETVAILSTLDVRLLVAATVHEIDDVVGDRAGSDRVAVAAVLPSHLVMPAVDLAVTAGGQGSAQTAMAAGTPLLGIPLQPEQDLNLALLERLGAARAVAPRHVRSRLAAVAGAMLATDRHRHAAERVRGWYDAIDGPGNAADAILAAGERDA